MESNQVSTIPDMLNIETRILQIKTEILNMKTETIQMKFWISNMKNEAIKINIQILNIKTGTINIKKQLAYTKTLQMALHTIYQIISHTFEYAIQYSNHEFQLWKSNKR